MQTQTKFHHQFHFTRTFKCFISVSYQVQHSFSTFGVVRNELFLEDIEKSATEVFNTM